jgi:arylformamidase
MSESASEAAVYLAYTQADLDRAYDQRAWVTNADEVLARYAAAGARVRASMHYFDNVAYGPTADETLAIFPATQPNAPVHVHVHGGSWRHLTKDDESFLAPGFVAAGVTLVVLNFAVIPAVRIPQMIEQLRRAIVWVAGNIERYGGDPQRIHLSGHSSGAHLASVLLTTDWTAYGLGADVLKSGLLISGMYDLRPVMLSARRTFVSLEAGEMEELSAILHLDGIAAPVTVAYGDLESPEFKRQAIDFAAALREARKPVTLIEAAGRNHFEILGDLADQDSALGATAFAPRALGDSGTYNL